MADHSLKLVIALLGAACSGTAFAQGALASAEAGGEAPAETSTATVDTHHKLYVGADYQMARFSVSNSEAVNGFAVSDYDSQFVDLRVGYRVLDAVGVEAHYGVPAGSSDSEGKVKTDAFYAAYVVPTGTLFEALEISAPVGYAYAKLKDSTNSASRSGVAFGLNLELPMRALLSRLPDVRVTGGGTVFNHGTDARYYGYHAGLRWDFGF